ncbi:16S rRNA (uracil(1498)-N(3))-methyltransferase [Enterococcus alcedinis]|uniref:Ribosomal RNA small subunit methyltransferase E n=1 Tax=Enterococcus alcedinis TaxID=1274384 RepID=A0A917JIF0_9ENTE|nr:16S rRNA (uracil(1498)-N(3))-methyltransferase [Enterococcus alcedinis]MBP2102676.1 16S rRNA (uracil1498-N3)-methyltransferase [Enterococcus alcedinis]GGI66236.1 ribosomal RNA small subunit methyltransferase E [Enterococcus alcedinis]
MQRYFINEDYQVKARYQTEGNDYHHMIRVMRMAIGDQVYLAFSNQVSIIAEITEILEDRVELKEIAKEEQTKELPVQITIASGYPKGDKLDLIFQKATELGAHDLIGFPAQSSVVKWDDKKLKKKQQRLSKIVEEAAEQSHRQLVPNVTLYAGKEAFYQQLPTYDQIIVAYEESAKQGEKSRLAQVFQSLQPGQRVLAIFGPEGGLTAKEIETFTQAGAHLCGLGPRILRCETAPLYLLGAASYQFELQ